MDGILDGVLDSLPVCPICWVVFREYPIVIHIYHIGFPGISDPLENIIVVFSEPSGEHNHIVQFEVNGHPLLLGLADINCRLSVQLQTKVRSVDAVIHHTIHSIGENQDLHSFGKIGIGIQYTTSSNLLVCSSIHISSMYRASVNSPCDV